MDRDEAAALAREHYGHVAPLATTVSPPDSMMAGGEVTAGTLGTEPQPYEPEGWVIDAIIAASIAAQTKRQPEEADLSQALLARAIAAARNGSTPIADLIGLVDAYVKVRR